MNLKLIILLLINQLVLQFKFKISYCSNFSNNEFKSDELYDYEDNRTLATNRLNQSAFKQTKLFECKSDSSCVDSQSICLNGNCVKICTNIDFKLENNKCVYFHCDSKKLILSNSSSNLVKNYLDNFSIETNNYPLLNRYLSKAKCSWILKNVNDQNDPIDSNKTQTNSFIQLSFERFSTQLANDYLYIFAGDSIYSPLIAALR